MLHRNLTYSTAMRTRPLESLQRGLSAFGALVVLALAAVAAYYVYTGATGEGEAPTCASEYQSCMKGCSVRATDNGAIQACQKKCEDDLDFCRMAAKRNR